MGVRRISADVSAMMLLAQSKSTGGSRLVATWTAAREREEDWPQVAMRREMFPQNHCMPLPLCLSLFSYPLCDALDGP